jgi:short-subunit dehydrogenase
MKNFSDYLQENISGKNVLISGGTTGIGRATAVMLASIGANVLIFGRNQQQLDETLHAIKENNAEANCNGLLADLANPADITTVFDKVDKIFDQLDIMINNAGLAFQGITDGNYADWEYILKTNLLGTLACSHEAIARMRKQGKGHIVNIGSMSADVREKDSSVYVATKAGIQGFSEAFRKEANELGIKVSLIEPGAVDTDMQDGTASEKEEKNNNMEMLKSEDIAMAVVYCLAQEKRTAVVNLQIRPQLQLI